MTHSNARGALFSDTDEAPLAISDPPNDLAPIIPSVLLTAKQAAALFGRTCRTLRNWEGRGWLRPVRIGRGVFFRRSDVEFVMEHGSRPPETAPAGTSQPPQSLGNPRESDAP